MRAQGADQRQRSGPDLPAGHTCGQCAPMRLAAARATTRIAAVLVYLRLEGRWNIEHLVAYGLVGQRHHRRAAYADLGRRAVDDLINLGFIEQRASTALVPCLRTALAHAGPALRPVAAGWPIGGGRL